MYSPPSLSHVRQGPLGKGGCGNGGEGGSTSTFSPVAHALGEQEPAHSA